VNSSHQLWSLWVATVTVPFHASHVTPLFRSEMRTATARWYRQVFGSASEMKLDYELLDAHSRFTVACRTEGAPAPDPVFRKQRMDAIARFFGESLRMFGKAEVRIDVRVEAGDVGDGKPPAQVILGPSVALLPRSRMFGL
jgi:hypothetical protein